MSDFISQGAGAMFVFAGAGLLAIAALGGWGPHSISNIWRIILGLFGVAILLFMGFIVFTVALPENPESSSLLIYMFLVILGLGLIVFAILDWFKMGRTHGIIQLILFIAGAYMVLNSLEVLFPNKATYPQTTSQKIRDTIDKYFNYVDTDNYDLAWEIVRDGGWVLKTYDGERAKWQQYYLSHDWQNNNDYYKTIVPYEENKAFAKMEIKVWDEVQSEYIKTYSLVYVCLLFDYQQDRWLIDIFNLDGKPCEPQEIFEKTPLP